jgi:hypothetical protein
MAVGDTGKAGARLSEARPDDGRRVRHFDQLDHDQQHEFLRLYRGEAGEPSLRSGTVIVFTDYYRVEWC